MSIKSRSVNKNRVSDSSFNKFVGVIKVIRIELLITFTALIISVGQYFQNSINARINITSTWRAGYTTETRDRVNRFIVFYKQAKVECSSDNLKNSLDIIADADKLYAPETDLINDCFIKNLVANEVKTVIKEKKKHSNESPVAPTPVPSPTLAVIKEKKKISDESRIGEIAQEEINKNKGATTPPQNTAESPEDNQIKIDAHIEIVLKYKNALIECLNTLEAVKAVIQSKPLPFRISIFYKDTLEGRYKDIIEELRDGLTDFIEAYRRDHADRETDAWHVLTSDESYLNDLVNVILYFLIFVTVLVVVYFTKTRMQELGLLQTNKD